MEPTRDDKERMVDDLIIAAICYSYRAKPGDIVNLFCKDPKKKKVIQSLKPKDFNRRIK